jgi:hypothetical protein
MRFGAAQGEGEELMDVEGNGSSNTAKKVAAPPAPSTPSSIWGAHKEEFLSLLPFLWPKDEPRLKVFMVCAFVCLIAAKLFNICVPLAFKHAVDDVSNGRPPLNAVLCYGAPAAAQQPYAPPVRCG